MAVYTQVSTEEMIAFLHRYDHGTLISAKGIAEGVENSNYLIETTGGRFILTLYEKRVNVEELPFFCALTDHLASKGLNIPRMLRDRRGEQLQTLAGRPACLIEFLTGVSVTHPTPAQARAAGGALGDMHRALADFRQSRPNSLDLPGWQALADRCGGDLDRIMPGLGDRVGRELAWLDAHWPRHLPTSVIHADLFPDNVLMLGDEVSGVIDFYFACTDIRAWDVAVTHAAWCFENDGTGYHAELGRSLITGYDKQFGLSIEERLAFPILARGACLRFLLTRAFDWINTPADAMVTRKDPIAFLRRLDFYAEADPEALLPI